MAVPPGKSRTRLLVQWILTGGEGTEAKTDFVDLPSIRIGMHVCESCSLTGQCINNDDSSSFTNV